MKKMISLLLVLVMMLSLAACGNTDPDETEASVKPPVITKAPDETAASTEAGAAVDLCILKETDDGLLNTYSLLAVNSKASFVDTDGNAVSDVTINTSGANALIQWLLSEEALALVEEFGVSQYGESLYSIREDAPVYTGKISAATKKNGTIRLTTTTAVSESGLLDCLLPVFEEAYGYTVEVESTGTDRAIAAAKAGSADLLLVHSPEQEEALISDGFTRVADGFETERISFFYNYFVLCGPSADPAGAAAAASAAEAFAAIADGKYTFVSRGDNSTVHARELTLWPADLGITARERSFEDYTEWYVSADAGMEVCLVIAEEMGAYILTDKATFLTFTASGGILD